MPREKLAVASIEFGRKREFVAVVFLLAMTISHIALGLKLAPLLRLGYQDFTIFYTAGQMVRSGQTAALYDLPAQYRMQQQFVPDVRIRQGPLPYNHPPFEALLFVPFTFVGYVPAYVLWTVINLVLLVAALALLRKHFAEIRTLSPVFLGLAAAGFFPIAIALFQGQDSILLLLILASSLVALERERDTVAGAVLAAGLFKFQLIIPLLLILVIRRWRLLCGFVPVALALAGGSVAMLGWRGTADYVRFVLYLEKSGAGGAIVAADMPNLRGLIACLPGINSGSSFAMVLTLVSSMVVFLAAFWRVRQRRDSVAFSFGLATVATILVSYHLLPYDLSLLLPVALLLFTASGQTEWGDARADLSPLLLLFLTPLYVLLWFHLNRLGCFALVLLWLFWRLTRGKTWDTRATVT